MDERLKQLAAAIAVAQCELDRCRDILTELQAAGQERAREAVVSQERPAAELVATGAETPRPPAVTAGGAPSASGAASGKPENGSPATHPPSPPLPSAAGSSDDLGPLKDEMRKLIGTSQRLGASDERTLVAARQWLASSHLTLEMAERVNRKLAKDLAAVGARV